MNISVFVIAYLVVSICALERGRPECPISCSTGYEPVCFRMADGSKVKFFNKCDLKKHNCEEKNEKLDDKQRIACPEYSVPDLWLLDRGWYLRRIQIVES